MYVLNARILIISINIGNFVLFCEIETVFCYKYFPIGNNLEAQWKISDILRPMLLHSVHSA